MDILTSSCPSINEDPILFKIKACEKNNHPQYLICRTYGAGRHMGNLILYEDYFLNIRFQVSEGLGPG